MIRKHLPVAIGALSVACAAAGAHAAQPSTWMVDMAHSKLGFDSAYSSTRFSGAFKSWSAAIQFDPANLAASKATVTIDLASATTGDPDRDETLPESDWFNTSKFPRATFTTGAIKAIGDGRYQAAGVITLKGLSKPATLNFTVQIKGKTAVMTGQAVLDRTQWSVGEGQFKDEKPVPHAVTVNVSITANRLG
jgi:polyisoprenoid-binding protein YceI